MAFCPAMRRAGLWVARCEGRSSLLSTDPGETCYDLYSGSQRRSGFDCGLALMPQDSGREKYAGAVPHYRSPPLYTPQLQ